MRFVERTGLPFWIPLVLGLFALADGALRLVPVDRFAFRDWEAMTAHQAPDGAFVPNKKYVNNTAYGDLANMGNYPELRQIRKEVFTTDRHGFRNPPERETQRPIAGLLVGDSFVVGSGVADDATLSARIEALSGRLVYNTGGIRSLHFPDLERMVQLLDMKRGTVIYVHLERKSIPDVERAHKALYSDTPASPHGEIVQWLIDRWLDLPRSRLQIALNRAYHQVSGPVGDGRVTLAHLRDGSAMLFFKEEFESAREERTLNIDFFRELQTFCEERKLGLVVVLVPNKLTVYGPLSPDIEPLPPSYLDDLDLELRNARIPVLNLRAPLANTAAARLPQNELLYWRDDTHWNARGIDYAARLIVQALRWAR